MERPDQPDERPHPEDVPERLVELPRWVPVVIGVTLVAMAALALYTGMFHRAQSIGTTLLSKTHVRKSESRPHSGAPGEPEPGASRVFHGDAGDAVPVANPAVKDSSRVAITGGGTSGVVPVVRLAARRGVMFQVEPPDALVLVNDQAIAVARQHSTAEDIYEFPEEGSYTIRIVAPGYRNAEFVITATADAREEVAVIRAVLKKI